MSITKNEKWLRLAVIIGGLVTMIINWSSYVRDGSFYVLAAVFGPLGFVLGMAWLFKPFPHIDTTRPYRDQVRQIPPFWYTTLALGLGAGLINFYLLSR